MATLKIRNGIPFVLLGVPLLIVLFSVFWLSPAVAQQPVSATPPPGGQRQVSAGSTRTPRSDTLRVSDSTAVMFFPSIFKDYVFPTPVSPPGMVYIPSGNFQMGCVYNSYYPCNGWGGDELPLHTVYISPFNIDKYPVTNGRYAGCVSAGVCGPPAHNWSSTRGKYYNDPTYLDYPVIYVNWYQAKTFCAWEGKRLPTEAEREKAARGSGDTRTFPWGDTAPDCTMANFRPYSGPLCVGDTVKVGTYPANISPYSVMDMAGNVWEWVNDWYQADYYSVSPIGNPQGPATGTMREMRGGSWFSTGPYARVSKRGEDSPWAIYDYVGFRCAR